jgi:hypothetical protein
MKLIKTLIMVLISFTAFSQSKFQVGMETGLGISVEVYNDLSGFKPSMSFIVSPTLEYRINNKISFKTGFQYEKKGFKVISGIRENEDDSYAYSYLINDTLIDLKYIYNFHYVGIPSTMKFYLGKKNFFYTNVGINQAILIRHNTTEFHYGNNTSASFKNIEDLSNFKSYELGLILGIGSEIPIKKNFSISTEIRNIYSVTKQRNTRINNSILTIGVIYSFKKKQDNA